jgi:mannose/cellobiose epimerase-like protein (N-acyl-D-glucosamine 2-epimerase family)
MLLRVGNHRGAEMTSSGVSADRLFEQRDSGLAARIQAQVLPTWSSLGRTDFGAPADPVGALRYPQHGPIATLRVQAQVISARAKAEAAGVAAANAPSFPAYLASLLSRFLSPDGDPGMARVVLSSGKVLDARRCLDDHAWMLRALADSFVATHSRDILLVADLILEFLDGHLASDSIGYFEDNEGGGGHRQASHAHLLEALLTLHAATGSAAYLRRAASLFELFRFHLLEPKSLNVSEMFDRKWQPAPVSGESAYCTASVARWIALLQRHHAAAGDDQALDLMQMLGLRMLAQRNELGLIVSSVGASGLAGETTMRLQDQLLLCQALRALAASDGRHWSDLSRLEALVARYFIEPAPRGCWCESIDANGESLGETISIETLSALVDHVARTHAVHGRVDRPARAMHAA